MLVELDYDWKNEEQVFARVSRLRQWEFEDHCLPDDLSGSANGRHDPGAAAFNEVYFRT